MDGDIKPDNFVVAENWTVKISDFGEASQTTAVFDVVEQVGKKVDRMKKNTSMTTVVVDLNTAEEKMTATATAAEGVQPSAKDTTVGGTIQWLAPERLAPIYRLFLEENNRSEEWNFVGSDLTKAADVYSFSLCVWEILTGK